VARAAAHGRGRNRAAIGARVTLAAGGRTQVEEVRGTSSYAAFQDLRLVFGGLGEPPVDLRVTVRWPDGTTTTHGPLEPNRYHALKEPE
jgi:hypothetical protein